MRFDFSAAEQFLSVLEGCLSLEMVLDHPAYQMVFLHGRRFGNAMTPGDVHQALAGRPSPFYGLRRLNENLPRIYTLLDTLRARQPEWQSLASAELTRLLPGENLDDITVYPIIGYDMGIGLGDSICMNLNTSQYLDEPFEFLYFIIHEAVHILYERNHPIPGLAQIVTPHDWQQYFSLWLQNEGFAVYAPYRLRAANQHLADRDYQVLEDPHRLVDTLKAFAAICLRLDGIQPLPLDDALEAVFGSQRVTYRAGCHIFRCIEQYVGLPAVREAFYTPVEDFITRYADVKTDSG